MTGQPLLHLVGSVPLANAEAVFLAVADAIGDRVRSIPDGETGDRIGWIRHLEEKLTAHPDLEVDSSYPPFELRQWDGQLLREIRWLGFRAGANLETVHFETGYADAALASFAVFDRLQSVGRIPAAVRFQVSLPTPMAAAFHYISPPSRENFVDVYQRSLEGELARIVEQIPGEKLTMQWDVCQEVLVFEGYYPERPDDFREQISTQLARLGDAIPEDVGLGYHLCYGSPKDEHLVQPQDLSILVEMAQGIVDGVDRRVDYLHMPVPRGRSDDDYFAPLDRLVLPAGTSIYLGLIHFDDDSGNQARYDAARAHFEVAGVASECGWGRSNPKRVPGLLQAHSRMTGHL